MMDKTALYQELIDCGVLQFGMFGADEAPYLIQMGLLPSYPMFLREFAQSMRDRIPNQTERLLCVASAYAPALALSLYRDIPLVYSLGTTGSGVADLIGAYDVGHPTCLIADMWRGEDALLPIIQKAEQVGLRIRSILCCFSIGQPEIKTSSLSVQSWVDLADMVEVLIENQSLSPAMRQMLAD
jgi:orotate phosphoribosyltransferase